jgi:hypothetical protein
VICLCNYLNQLIGNTPDSLYGRRLYPKLKSILHNQLQAERSVAYSVGISTRIRVHVMIRKCISLSLEILKMSAMGLRILVVK